MARRQRELWANLVSPQFGGPVVSVNVVLEIPDAVNTDYVIYQATRDVAIRRARVCHEVSPDGTSIYALVNVTDSVDLSSADIDADALAANVSSAFSLGTNADKLEEGDVVALEWESTATVFPGTVVVSFEVEYLELKND